MLPLIITDTVIILSIQRGLSFYLYATLSNKKGQKVFLLLESVI